jgi:hypothetical protein
MNLEGKYGVANIKVENRRNYDNKILNSGKIEISLKNLHNGKIDKYILQGKKKTLNKKRIILRAGEYHVRMKNYDNLTEVGFIVKPFEVLEKNEIQLRLPAFISKPINFNILVRDENTGKEITPESDISFREENGEWQKYSENVTLFNGKKYEFKANAEGYLSSFPYEVDFSYWMYDSSLEIKLLKVKTVVYFQIPPVTLDVKINGEKYWNTKSGEQDVEKVFLPKKGECKKIYCYPGNYLLVFSNKKEGILIEKNILVPQADKEVHISFEKDGGDELCAVLKINNFQKKD